MMRVPAFPNNAKLFALAVVLALFLAPAPARADVTKTNVGGTDLQANVQLVEYETSCRTTESDSDLIQGIIMPRNPASVRSVYFYFPGNTSEDAAVHEGGSDPERVCNPNTDGKTQFCKIVNNNQQFAVVTFNRNDAHTNTDNWLDEASDIQCFLREARTKIQAYNMNPSELFVSGHSGGGKQVAWAVANGGVGFSKTIFWDACYGTQCSSTAPRDNAGQMYLYYRAGTDTQADAEKAKQENSLKTKLVETTLRHPAIPNGCFLDPSNNDLCGGRGEEKGELVVGTVEPPFPLGLVFDETQLIIQQPQPRITIPGLQFSDPEELRQLIVREPDGSVYIQIPFLGQYLAAVYQWAVAAAGIIAVLVLIFSGVQWMMPGNVITNILTKAGGERQEESQNKAKKRIAGALIGLVLAVGSYVILYSINPDLVEFKSLRIPYIIPKPLVETDEPVDSIPFSALPAGAPDPALLPTAADVCFPLTRDSLDPRRGISWNWGSHRDGSDSDACEADSDRCHAGIDIYSKFPGQVVAVADGIVKDIRHVSRCADGWGAEGAERPGDGIVIYHRSLGLTFNYAEVDEGTSRVQEGQEVRKGDILGVASYCGMLHFEVYQGEVDRFQTLNWCPPGGIDVTERHQCATQNYPRPDALANPNDVVRRLEGNFCR